MVVHRSGMGTVRMWNRTSGVDVLVLPDQPEVVYGVGFSKDASRIVATCQGTVKMWDAVTGQEVFSLVGGTHAVAFSPSGNQLACAASDSIVRIWDATPLDDDLDFQRERVAREMYDANQHRRTRRVTEAIASYARASKHLEELLGKSPDSNELRSQQAECFSSAGQTHYGAGQLREALPLMEKAADTWQQLVNTDPNRGEFRRRC